MTSRQHLLAHVLVGCYLLVTLSAFIYTMTRFTMPIVPSLLTYWSYGMMAPYQGDTPWNADVRVEGQLPDGTWEEVSLNQYLPHGFGEKNVRKLMPNVRPKTNAGKRKAYTAYALQVLDREREQGKPYTALRIWMEQWDRSNGGYDFLRVPGLLTRTFLTHVQ